MKYDKDGIPCGFDDFEHIPKFVEQDDANEWFKRLKQEIPWAEVSWNDDKHPTRLVFRYTEMERRFRLNNVLEEIIKYIEAVVETDVLEIWCDLYRNGDDYNPYHKGSHDNSHLLILTLGETRTFSIREKENDPDKKDVAIGNGDMIHISPEINGKYEYSVTKTKEQKDVQINITLFTRKPYILRNRHLRTLQILGQGTIPLWFEGSECNFPDDAVAVIVPSQQSGAYPSNLRDFVEVEYI